MRLQVCWFSGFFVALKQSAMKPESRGDGTPGCRGPCCYEVRLPAVGPENEPWDHRVQGWRGFHEAWLLFLGWGLAPRCLLEFGQLLPRSVPDGNDLDLVRKNAVDKPDCIPAFL